MSNPIDGMGLATRHRRLRGSPGGIARYVGTSPDPWYHELV